jgi:hypothetical protein
MNTFLISAYLLSTTAQYTTGIESIAPEFVKQSKTVGFAKSVSELRFLAFTIPVSIQALKTPQPLQIFKEPIYMKPDHFPLSVRLWDKPKVTVPKTHFVIKFTSTEIPFNKVLHLSEGLWDAPPHERKRTLLADVSKPLPF